MYPKRRIFLPLFLFCAYDSSVLQNFKIFTHLFPNFSYKDTRLTEVMCTTALTSKIGSEKFQKFKYGTFLTLSLKLMQWYVTSVNRGSLYKILFSPLPAKTEEDYSFRFRPSVRHIKILSCLDFFFTSFDILT
jgi:hypothetical protein